MGKAADIKGKARKAIARWAAARLESEGLAGGAARAIGRACLGRDAARSEELQQVWFKMWPADSWMADFAEAGASAEGIARTVGERAASDLLGLAESRWKSTGFNSAMWTGDRTSRAGARLFGGLARKAPKTALGCFWLLSAALEMGCDGLEGSKESLGKAIREGCQRDLLAALWEIGRGETGREGQFYLAEGPKRAKSALEWMIRAEICDAAGWARMAVDANVEFVVFGAKAMGAPMDEPGEDGRTPLQQAARRGLGPVSRALVACGADPTKKAPRARKEPMDRLGEKLRKGGGPELGSMLEKWDLSRAIAARAVDGASGGGGPAPRGRQRRGL